MRKFWLFICGGVGASCAHAAPLTLTGSAEVLSEYRYQGLSLSNSDPSVHVSVEANSDTGLYAGASAWSVSGARLGGAQAKLNTYAGFTRALGLLSYDIGARYTSFPDAISGYSYLQPYASLRGSIAYTSARVGVSYTPRQGLAPRASTYYQAEITQQIPRKPLTLKAHIGYVYSRFGPQSDHLDFLVGGDYVWHKLVFNLSYGGTDEGRGLAGANFSNVRPKLMTAISYHF